MFFLLRYFKVLIQEMEVKIDMSFIMACIGLFSFDAIDRSQEVRMLCAVFIQLAHAFTALGCISTGVR